MRKGRSPRCGVTWAAAALGRAPERRICHDSGPNQQVWIHRPHRVRCSGCWETMCCWESPAGVRVSAELRWTTQDSASALASVVFAFYCNITVDKHHGNSLRIDSRIFEARIGL